MKKIKYLVLLLGASLLIGLNLPIRALNRSKLNNNLNTETNNSSTLNNTSNTETSEQSTCDDGDETNSVNIKMDTHLIGAVFDKGTGEHMGDVTIQIVGTNVGVLTDATGHFFIKSLPEGTYTARASFLGYTSQDITFDLKLNKVQDLKFYLVEDAFMLDNVVVSASRNDTKKMDAPSVVSIITPKLMTETNSINLGQSLNFQPGVRVETGCQNCGITHVRMNGLDGAYTQILLNNRPILSALSSVYILDQIPASMIDHIEIINGGGSTLFGSNAIAGTINIITKQPLSNSLALSNTSIFTDNAKLDYTNSANASIISDDKQYGASVYGSQRKREAWDANSDGFSEIGALKDLNLGFNTFFNLGLQSKLTVQGSTSHEYRRGGDSLQMPAHLVQIAEQIETTTQMGGLDYHWFTPDFKHDLSIYASGQYVERTQFNGAQHDKNAYGWSNSTTAIGGIQYNYAMDQLLFMPAKLTVGAEMNYENIADTSLYHSRDFEQDVETYSAFFQNAWKNNVLTLLVGARLDKNTMIDDPIFSPRVNVKYSPIESLSIRTGYAMGYRAPQIYQKDLHVAAVNGIKKIIINDPNLTPEYSHSLNFAVEWHKHMDAIGLLSLSANGFYTKIEDVFFLKDLGVQEGYFTQERINGEGSKVYGVNMEGKYTPSSRLNFQLGFTLQASKYDEAQTFNTDVAATKEVYRLPNQYGFFNINYQPIKNLTASFSSTYTGDMLVAHHIYDEATASSTAESVRTPEFYNLNIKLSYDFHLGATTVLQLNGGVMNILNDYQDDFDKGTYRDADYIYGPSAPISCFVGFNYTL